MNKEMIRLYLQGKYDDFSCMAVENYLLEAFEAKVFLDELMDEEGFPDPIPTLREKYNLGKVEVTEPWLDQVARHLFGAVSPEVLSKLKYALLYPFGLISFFKRGDGASLIGRPIAQEEILRTIREAEIKSRKVEIVDELIRGRLSEKLDFFFAGVKDLIRGEQIDLLPMFLAPIGKVLGPDETSMDTENTDDLSVDFGALSNLKLEIPWAKGRLNRILFSDFHDASALEAKIKQLLSRGVLPLLVAIDLESYLLLPQEFRRPRPFVLYYPGGGQRERFLEELLEEDAELFLEIKERTSLVCLKEDELPDQSAESLAIIDESCFLNVSDMNDVAKLKKRRLLPIVTSSISEEAFNAIIELF